MSFNVEADMRGVDELLAELGDAAEAAVRPVAQAGAQVIYDYARRSAPVSTRPHMFYGTASKGAPKGQKAALAYGANGQGGAPYQSGNFRDSIYQVYSKDNSGKSVAQYHVSFNFKKAPYGFMLEYGTSRAPAKPTMRSAMSVVPAAVDAMENEAIRRVEEAMSK